MTQVATGINIAPGSEDDGWETPDPVRLDDGSVVQLYKDGEALRAAYEAIEQAKSLVCMEMYIFADDPTGKAFAELLIKKATQGVHVYLIYDSIGSISTDRAIFDRMRLAGVKVQEFHPIRPWECKFSWRPFNRDHRKLLVIDGDRGGLGGLNVGHEYAGSWVFDSEDHKEADFWRDNAIGIRGPAAKQLLKAFACTWNYCLHGGPIKRSEYAFDLGLPRKARGVGGNRVKGAGGLKVAPKTQFGLLASSPNRCSELKPMLRALLRDAKKSVLMTMAYFAPDNELTESLLLAAKRGVKIRLMLPARSDLHILIVAARSFYETLMQAGIEIFERQGVVLHAKTMVIDKRVTVIGSSNLDYRSIDYNLESSAIVRSAEFGRQMHDLFANDIKFAKQIDPAEWRRRTTIDRVVQWAVYRTRYLL